MNYSINNNSCNIQALTNSTSTSYVVPNTNHDDRVYVCVTSKNLAGNSEVARADNQIPVWTSVPLQNNWGYYNPGETPPYEYDDFGFTQTANGEVHLKGLLKSPANITSGRSVIAVLPEGYRPDTILLFTAFQGSADRYARIDVSPDGTVTFDALSNATNATNAFLSLNSIRFMAQGTCTFTQATLTSPWRNYNNGGTVYGNVKGCRDSWNIIHTQGLPQNTGTFTAWNVFANFNTANLLPEYAAILPSSSSKVASSFQIARGASGGAINSVDRYGNWLSTTGRVHHESHTAWSPISLANNWQRYSTSYANAEYTKQGRLVTIRGMVKLGPCPRSFIGNAMPAGFRPARRIIFPVTDSGGNIDRVDVLPNGTIEAVYCGTNGWLSLNNISFIAEQ